MGSPIRRAGMVLLVLLFVAGPEAVTDSLGTPERAPGYACEENLIEVMFEMDSRVRLRSERLVDLSTDAVSGVDRVLETLAWHEWERICDLPEERLDEFQARGETNTGRPVYNLNNIYRLRIPDGQDVWAIAGDLEALPGILYARPVPRPAPLPLPADYQWAQGYQDPAIHTPTGIDAEWAWTQLGGDGSGVTVCDLEYGWYYRHQDCSKALGSQINPNPIFYPAGADTNHGTAVVGVLVSDDNGWGTKGICHGASLLTCGTYYGSPNPSWNVAQAIGYAMNHLSAGDVLSLQQQWEYTPGAGDYIPIEWWGSYWPNAQVNNPVYAAIVNAVSNGIHVVEAGGNGGVDTDTLAWYGDSGAIIVGGGGAYAGGTWPGGDLERLSFSSYGTRFDLQGWGEDVVTAGYGDRYNEWPDGRYDYTSIFSGTSSASAVAAGAVACCVGHWTAQGGDPSAVTPAQLRTILTSTGTAQVTPPSGNIGPRPNLLAALAQLGAFADATTVPVGDNSGASGFAWGDYDGDGDPDLYVANATTINKLFRNDGGGAFTDVTATPINDPSNSSAPCWGDYDDDGDLDLYVVNYGSANKLFRNFGTSFVEVASGTPAADAGNGVAGAWGDYDNDGDLDLYVAMFGSLVPNKLFRNDGGGAFTDATPSPLNDSGDGSDVAWADYDNDGDLDLYLGNHSMANKLFRNEGGGAFSDVTTGPLGDASAGCAVGWGDYDGDGDLDLYIANNGANKLLQNRVGTSRHWLAVDLVEADGGVGGIGARVQILAGGAYQIREVSGGSGIGSQNSLTVEFGLGSATTVDMLEVQWPTGTVDLLANVAADQAITVTEGTHPPWVDATTAALNDSSNGTGVAWGDYDGDGDLDLYMTVSGAANKLFRNDGGGAFSDVTAAPLNDAGDGQGVAWGDYDNDGDLDLLVANGGVGAKLFRNDGGGSFSDVTSGPLVGAGNIMVAPWGDYDRDGDIDAYLVSYGSPNVLVRNDGGGSFANATSYPMDDFQYGFGCAWGDYDNDGDLDMYLVNGAPTGSTNKLFRNNGGGSFSDVTAAPLNDTGYGRAAAWGDYDNDGDLDLYVANYGGANKLFRNDGGTFADATSGPLGDTGYGTDVAWGDYDNDGDLDLYLAKHIAANRLFRNQGGGVFTDATSGPLGDTGQSCGVTWGDYDGDGDLDLYVVNGGGANKLFRNQLISAKTRSADNWLHVDLVEADGGVGGIGARVRAVAGGRTQIREVSGGSGVGSQNSLTVEFGLGSASVVDTLEVYWPTGEVDTLVSVAGGRTIVVDEGGYSDVEDERRPAALAFRLDGNYPNPFNPSTTIHFHLPTECRVRLDVFNVRGRRVANLIDRVEGAGEKHVPWNAEGLPSGVYLLRVQAGREVRTSKMILLR